MSRPIKLTDDIVSRIKEKVADQLKIIKTTDGVVKVSINLNNINATTPKTVVEFSQKAIQKMYALVFTRDKEIGWKGTVSRIDDEHFIIKDVFVPPQTVTAASYRTDQAEFAKWLQTLSDEDYNSLRFDGHSHVDMSVTPSSLDIKKQKEVVEQLNDDGYYIFVIMNKKFDIKITVYDYKRNLVTEDNEVEIIIPDEFASLKEFVADANQKSVNQTSIISATPPKLSEITEEDDMYEYEMPPYPYSGKNRYY